MNLVDLIHFLIGRATTFPVSKDGHQCFQYFKHYKFISAYIFYGIIFETYNFLCWLGRYFGVHGKMLDAIVEYN